MRIYITLFMTKDGYFIGIDSGGTNCRISASDTGLEVFSSIVYPSVHYSTVGCDEFSSHTASNIRLFLEQSKLEIRDCHGICAGVAGARSKQNKEEIRDSISGLLNFRKVVIDSDTAIAYEDAHGDKDGLVLICGTGSVLFGRINGEQVRLGGWGKILGDDGSSYFLSLNFLKKLVKYFDRYEETAGIEHLLKEKYGIDRNNIIEKIYHRKFEIASLSPFIVEQAAKGDPLCMHVADTEAESILELFEAFTNRYKPKKQTGIAFTGSLIENKNYFSDTLRDLMITNFEKEFFILENPVTPVNGALKIAINKFRG